MSGHLPAPPPVPLEPEAPRALDGVVSRLALATAWAARHPREPFALPPAGLPAERSYYRADDGWESPLWRCPPLPGASGEPVILAHGLCADPSAFDYRPERSLARHLQAAGYEVWLLEHRGGAGSVAPRGARGFDFDDIVEHDLPAAIDRVRQVSGAPRVHWVGHSMGGQLLYAWLAHGGAADIASAVTLCAPVRFAASRSRARVAAAVARLLPPGLAIPVRALAQAAAPLADDAGPFAADTEGPLFRGTMVHGVTDLASGLVRQAARWVETGTLCDRHDRVDYVEALRGLRLPILVLGAEGDRVCPAPQARAVLDALDPAETRWIGLDEGWGHLDPLLGRRAPEVVYPAVADWLERWRDRAWAEGPAWASAGVPPAPPRDR